MDLWTHGWGFKPYTIPDLCYIQVIWVVCAMNGYDSKQLVPLSVGLNQEALSQLITLLSVSKKRRPGSWGIV